jgi:hypothetical protein
MIEYEVTDFNKLNEMRAWLCEHISPEENIAPRWRVKYIREIDEIEMYGRTVQMAGKTLGYSIVFMHNEDYTLFALRWI